MGIGVLYLNPATLNPEIKIMITSSKKYVKTSTYCYSIRIRISRLPSTCVEEVEHGLEFDKETTITTGRTWIEGSSEDLLQAAADLRTREVWFDWRGTSEALYKRALKNAEDARRRWATKIENAVAKEAPE